MFEKTYRVLVLLLLVVPVGGVGAVGYFSYTDYQENTARASACRQAIIDTDTVSLLTNYQKDVYKSASVDNIYKQIFKANEFELMAITSQTLILDVCLSQ